MRTSSQTPFRGTMMHLTYWSDHSDEAIKALKEKGYKPIGEPRGPFYDVSYTIPYYKQTFFRYDRPTDAWWQSETEWDYLVA